MRREHTSIMLMKQCLSTIKYLQKKKIKLLPPEPDLSYFYHPSEAQKNGELSFVAVGTGTATYPLYKCLK